MGMGIGRERGQAGWAEDGNGDAQGTGGGRSRGRGRGDAPARRRGCRLRGPRRGSRSAFLREREREERRPQRLRVAPELPVLDQRPPDEPSEAGRVLRVGAGRHARTKCQPGDLRGTESWARVSFSSVDRPALEPSSFV